MLDKTLKEEVEVSWYNFKIDFVGPIQAHPFLKLQNFYKQRLYMA